MFINANSNVFEKYYVNFCRKVEKKLEKRYKRGRVVEAPKS